MTIKQILIVRKDLNMRKGKIASQCAHASMKIFFDKATVTGHTFLCQLTEEEKEWVEGRFTKICVSVDSEEDLLTLYQKAKELGLPSSLVTDAGLTEFGGVPTNTVVAIGPAHSDKIDSLTKHLKLL